MVDGAWCGGGSLGRADRSLWHVARGGRRGLHGRDRSLWRADGRLVAIARGEEAEADAGQGVGHGAVDEAREPALEPGQGVGVAGLHGEAAVAQAQGPAATQPLVEGRRIHPQREGVQDGLPGNFT